MPRRKVRESGNALDRTEGTKEAARIPSGSCLLKGPRRAISKRFLAVPPSRGLAVLQAGLISRIEVVRPTPSYA